ncbi:unnamed protein product [Meloidogyne enterolobii]|uniref:Uncharacterized protein n=1 Tax=Meloidogyne enterolobii TaxID=390850 RepID=A0ACB1A0N5_MELEN
MICMFGEGLKCRRWISWRRYGVFQRVIYRRGNVLDIRGILNSERPKKEKFRRKAHSHV